MTALIIESITVFVPVPKHNAIEVTLWRDGIITANEIGESAAVDGDIDWMHIDPYPGSADAKAVNALDKATPRLIALARGVFGEAWGTRADWLAPTQR